MSKKTSEWEKVFDKFWASNEGVSGHHTSERWFVAPRVIKAFISDLLAKEKMELVEEAFDWIWKGWNLDFGNKDRAKEHFISALKSEEKVDGKCNCTATYNDPDCFPQDPKKEEVG